MRGQGGPGDRAGAGDDVEHPGRAAGLEEQRSERVRVVRGHLRCLEHHRRPGCQGGGYLGDDLVDRHVPWGDGGDDTAAPADQGGAVDLVRPGEFACGAGGGSQYVGGQLRLGDARQRDRHSHLSAHDLRDGLAVAGEQIGGALEQRGTFGDVGCSPSGMGGGRGADGVVDDLRSGVDDLADCGLAVRVDHLVHRPAGDEPFAVDQTAGAVEGVSHGAAPIAREGS